MFISQKMYGLKIFLAGDEYTEDSGQLSYITITEDVTNPIPKLDIVLVMKASYVESNPIRDGMSIVIEENSTESRWEFRASSETSDVDRATGLVTTRILGWLDVPGIWVVNSSYSGVYTSSSVFQTVAQGLGLSYVGSSTNDRQAWCSGNQRVLDYLNFVADHAYSDDLSVFIWYIDKRKNITLNNLTRTMQNSSNTSFEPGIFTSPRKSGLVHYISYKVNSDFGVDNVYQGYGTDFLIFDALENKNSPIHPENYVKFSASLNINKNFASTVNVENYELNAGNDHPKMYFAENHNQRGRALWNRRITLQSSFLQPEITLGSKAELRADLVEGVRSDRFSGPHLITLIKTTFRVDECEVIYELTSQGFFSNTKDML